MTPVAVSSRIPSPNKDFSLLRSIGLKQNRTQLLGTKPLIPQICLDEGTPGLVSVLIPTYNRGYIIAPTIESVLSQTYQPIEIIVVDDGSIDDTKDVVSRYGDSVRYIYQDNAGLAVARNTGLAAARGEFIAFLDSDDVWFPWKIKAQVELMRSFPNLALVWTDMRAVSPLGDLVRDRHLSTMYHVYQKIDVASYMSNTGRLGDVCLDLPPEIGDSVYRIGDIFSPMFMGNLVHPPTALLRREKLRFTGGLDLTFSWTCEDYEFFWRVSAEGDGALIESPSMDYRVDAADQLTKPDLHLYIARGNLEALKQALRKNGHRIKLPKPMIRRHMAEAYSWVGEEELLSENGKWSAGFFTRSLVLNPLQKRTLSLFPFSFLPRPIIKFIRNSHSKLGGFSGYIMTGIITLVALMYRTHLIPRLMHLRVH